MRVKGPLNAPVESRVGRYASKTISPVRSSIRLYFVDTPESDSRFPERNAEQAAYFGITPEQSVQAGKEAREFVRKTLILTPGMGCHAKAQRRKEVGLARNPALLLRVNAEKIPTLCAFAALRLCVTLFPSIAGSRLMGKPATVFTRWASALGSSRLPRYYIVSWRSRGGILPICWWRMALPGSTEPA